MSPGAPGRDDPHFPAVDRYPPYPPPPRQRASTAITSVLAILLFLVAAALAWTLLHQPRLGSAPEPALLPAEPREITPRGDLAADEQATIELFRQVSPSVVHITSMATRRSRFHFNIFEIPQGQGSGFVWDEHGHVVTNFHVVQNADHAQVTLSDNSTWNGRIVGAYPDKDLAVLKIDAPSDKVRPIRVGSSSRLLVGQKVFAIGNPFGLDQTLTTGVISGLGREIQSVTGRPIYDMIQTDASINPGNSGGPLLDSHGRIIGVNTAIYSASGSSAGIGFAVPVDVVNSIVPQLIANGRVVRPGLGIQIAPDQAAAQLGLDGILITGVQPNSAAARAGLQGTRAGPRGGWILGDVIVGIDGHPIHQSSDLFRVLDEHKVGDRVAVTFERDGKTGKTDVVLQALP